MVDQGSVRPYFARMATPSVKTTLALDLETVRALDELARRWNVSRSEALRRAIRASASGPNAPPSASPQALRALDRLQKTLGVVPREAERWSASLRAERRASSRGRERRAR